MRFPVIAAALVLIASIARAEPPAVQTQEDADKVQVCGVVARVAVVACSRGYLKSGGTKDQEALDYKFGMAACPAAGAAAFNSCVDDTMTLKYLTTAENGCADLARYLGDAIKTGCAIARQKLGPETAGITATCLKDWATKGSDDYLAACKAQMAAQQDETKL